MSILHLFFSSVGPAAFVLHFSSIGVFLILNLLEQVAYTFDAGPNAVMIARNRKTAALLLQRLLFHFPPHSDTDLNRYRLAR